MPCGEALRKLGAVLLVTLVIMVLTRASGQVILFYGRVVDSEGKPVANAEITVLRDNLLVTTVFTAEDGSFQLQLPRGDYTLRISKLGYQPLYTLFSALPERGGDIGAFVLKEGVEIVPEALSFVAQQGEQIPIRLYVSNKGLSPIPIRFSYEAPPGWDCRLITPEGLSVEEVYVAPGSLRNLTLIVAIPFNATSTAAVRLTARWAELRKTYEFRFSVGERRWVVLEVPLNEVSSYPGALLRIPVRLSNIFPKETVFSIAPSAPAGWIATLLDSTGVSVSRLTLPPGSSRDLNLLVYVPPTASSGSYKLVVLAASEYVRTIQEITVNVESRYDLLNITLPLVRLNTTGGGITSVSILVKNTGNAPTTVLLTAKSQTQGIICRFQATGSGETSTYLLPGEEKIIYLTIEVLPEVQVGEYLVTFTATGVTSKVERSMVVRVEGVKSLEVSLSGLYVATAPGSTGVMNLRVVNRGTVPLNVSTRVTSVPPKFLVSTSPSSALLKPGETLVLSLSVMVPSNATEGYYNVAFVVEADGLREYRVIVLEVAGEAQMGFPALALPLAALSFAAVLYSQRRGRR